MTATVDVHAGIDRFDTPLCTVPEAARHLGVPTSTLASWTQDHRRRSSEHQEVGGGPVLVTSLPALRGSPGIPFVGLAEGVVLAGLRHGGVPMQRIRTALIRMEGFGIHHALASQRFGSDRPDLFASAVAKACLRHITFGADGYASLIHLPAYEVADVVVDPTRGFGQPIFSQGGARLDDALAMFRAGEPLEAVVAEYGMSREHMEDAVRVAAIHRR